jgi:putative hemolysin
MMLVLALCGLLLNCQPAVQSTDESPATATGSAGLPNPAAVYCQEQGYSYEIRTAGDGSQSGVCIFPDGSECDEWEFFRGECGPQPNSTPPVGDPPSGEMIHGEAVVETIDILILESFPVQVNVVARGYLPDGCTEIDEIHQERTDQTFQVNITTIRPADAVCTQAVEPFEETISLDVQNLPAGSYTVDVNGITDTFELTVDNALNESSEESVEPPPAWLAIAGQEQISGIGTYCWTQAPVEGETSVGICADMVGIPTSEEPLTASSPFTATFRLAPEERPDELLLEVISVTAADELERWPPGSRGWTFKPGERYSLSLERTPSIELSLEPGLYVLNLFGRWQAWGDASYGFLVEVQSPPAGLTVDEHAIVAAEVDGPGHFEYTDRLSEELLTRIEGLRAHAAEQHLTRANTALEPFGYQLEGRFDAAWNRTFYDLFKEGNPEPLLAGISPIWPVSVNASGTDFVLVAENAPNVTPLYLQIQAGSVEPWNGEQSNWLPPAYVGDTLARVTFTGFPTLTYQVELDDGQPTMDARAVYSGTAVAVGAYMPLQRFTTWDGHWVLEVDDHLIMDGQDLGADRGYDAAFGFSLIQGQPFYFFVQEERVRLSYSGRTLPQSYDQVFHNQCCEAAIHNIEALGDTVLFHALRDGVWYLVEAGVYEGEMAGTSPFTAPEGWSFRYPMHWDRLDEKLGLVQDTTTGKTVTFASQATTQAELEQWLGSEIARKLAATEAENTLTEPLSKVQKGDLTIYRYAIVSRMEASETLLRTTVFFDGQRRYELDAAIPPVAEEEYEAIVTSFQTASQ